MDEKSRRGFKTRMKRIVGQFTGIQRIIEEDRYWVDILNQTAAVRSALDSLGIKLLSEHLESCVVGHGTATEHANARPMTQEQLLDELRAVLTNFLK